jgi:uncharacterized protein (DUF2236 family)
MKFRLNRDCVCPDHDEGGVFAADAVIRQVHRERVVGVLYGPVAVMIMALDPVGFAGFVSGTDHGQPLVSRFVATAHTQEAIILGTQQEALKAIARVRQLHSRVPEANDPDLQLLVITCLFSAAQTVFERCIRRLTDGDRDALWQDYLDLAAMLGYPRHLAPANYAAAREYLDQRIQNGRLSDEQRELAIRASLQIPVRRRFRPLLAVVQCAVIGLLPARLRELYGLRWTPTRRSLFHLLIFATHALHAVMPVSVMHGAIADRLAEHDRRRQRAHRGSAEARVGS